MKRRKISIICIFSLVFTSLFAADRGIGTGFYGGIAVGSSSMSGDRQDSADIGIAAGSLSGGGELSGNAVQGQLFVGYMQKLWDTPFAVATEFYLGFDHLTQKRTGAIPVTGSDDAFIEATYQREVFFGIPVKVGYVPNDSWFFYGLIGLDMSVFSYRAEQIDRVIPTDKAEGKRMIYGISYGGGVDYRIPNSPVILGLEVKNTVYNRTSISVDNNGSVFDFNEDSSIFNVLFRAAYLF